MDIKYSNGKIWQAPNCNRYIIQWLGGDEFGLLSMPYKAISGGTAMMFKTGLDRKWRYKESELPERLKRCKYLDGVSLDEV